MSAEAGRSYGAHSLQGGPSAQSELRCIYWKQFGQLIHGEATIVVSVLTPRQAFSR